jgi:hypothetical protein
MIACLPTARKMRLELRDIEEILSSHRWVVGRASHLLRLASKMTKPLSCAAAARDPKRSDDLRFASHGLTAHSEP